MAWYLWSILTRIWWGKQWLLILFCHQISNISSQSACELVRQHIDHGGVFDPESQQWKEVNHVSYLSSYNPYTPPTTPKLSSRLLRHFSVFNVSFPRYVVYWEVKDPVTSCNSNDLHLYSQHQRTTLHLHPATREAFPVQCHSVPIRWNRYILTGVWRQPC